MTSVFSRLRLGSAVAVIADSGNLQAENIFGAASSVDPANYYVPGTGNPAVSTADYYHMDGLYWFRPYDLTQFGSAGTTLATANGRYFWICSPDHPSSNYGWTDAQDFMGGYSSDPGVLPERLTLLFRYSNLILRGGTEQWVLYQAPYLVYNPDDATYPFYIYAEGAVLGGAAASPHTVATQHEQGLARSTDLSTWVMFGPSHFNDAFLDWSSFQRVVRTDATHWYSVGLSSDNDAYGGFGKWTSSDGQSFTQVTNLLHEVVGNSVMGFADTITSIGGQTYALVREDNYNQPPYGAQLYARGSLAGGSVRQGMYVSLVPVDANWNAITVPSVVRVSDAYAGTYPGPTYLQNVAGYEENGVLHIYATKGFVPSSANQGLVDSVPYASGGGLWQQNVDYYTYITDASAAAAAAPCGVTASCVAGVVTLSWYDALPSNTYRVYRGTSSGTQATLVGDVTGIITTDSPTVGSQYWYKVVTLQSGTERASRVVNTYVS